MGHICTISVRNLNGRDYLKDGETDVRINIIKTDLKIN
jgi:hypothetical protein